MHDMNRVEIWLNKALEIENRGYDFYEDAAKTVKDSLVRDFFNTLAAQELIHIKIIKKIHERLGDGGDSCWLAAREHNYSEASVNKIFLAMSKQEPTPDEDILKAIDTGMALESESLNFYQNEIPKASCEAEKKFLTALAAEENDHHQTLADMKLYYSDPQAWLEKMDNMHLDGV